MALSVEENVDAVKSESYRETMGDFQGTIELEAAKKLVQGYTVRKIRSVVVPKTRNDEKMEGPRRRNQRDFQFGWGNRPR